MGDGEDLSKRDREKYGRCRGLKGDGSEIAIGSGSRVRQGRTGVSSYSEGELSYQH